MQPSDLAQLKKSYFIQYQPIEFKFAFYWILTENCPLEHLWVFIQNLFKTISRSYPKTIMIDL